MSNLILNVLIAVVRVLNNLIAVVRMLNNTDTEVNVIDVEFEFEAVTDGQLDFFGVLDEVVEVTEVETAPVVETEEVVTEVDNFDFSSIIAALGLATPVVEVEEAPVVETVVVNNVVYVIRYMTNVDVTFTGRVNRSFTDVEGFLFEGSDGTSDFLLRVQAPLSLANAKEWMARNDDVRYFTTRVVVTPTISKFI